jgi:hypothetical protein
MKLLIGLLITMATISVVVALAIKSPPYGARVAKPVELKMRTVRVVWAESYASSLSLPNNNAEGSALIGDPNYFGPQKDMGEIAEFNVTSGGILEVLLHTRDDQKMPHRAALIPRVLDDGRVDGFTCVSDNWTRIAGLYRDCTYDKYSRAAEKVHRDKMLALATPPKQAWRPPRQTYSDDASVAREMDRESQERAQRERDQRLRELEWANARAREELEMARRKADSPHFR